MKTAIIVGCEGQDGRIAFDALVYQGYRVLGVGRSSVRTVGLDWKTVIDITDKAAVVHVVKSIQADEIYYLAAVHYSSQDSVSHDRLSVERSYAVNVLGLYYFLESIKEFAQHTRLFYASSSLIFEGTTTQIQDECTPFSPQSIYGITKLDGQLLCRLYREKHRIFAACGILYNHESKYRSQKFISTKIINGAIAIKEGRQENLILGNLSAEVDWGYAPDYVEAMGLILRRSDADEFIIATGHKHAVHEFAACVFDSLGLDWRQYVREDKNLVGLSRHPLVGNPQKLKNVTGWKVSMSFKEMIGRLLADMELSSDR